MQVERVKIVAQILLTHLNKDRLDLTTLKRAMDIDAVTVHSSVDFSRVFCRLWRVVFQEGNLVVMAEGSKLFKEVYILDVDRAKLLSYGSRCSIFKSSFRSVLFILVSFLE